MEELNMIAEKGIPIFKTLADQYGTSTEQVLEMSSKGQISAAHIEKAFQTMTSEGGIFFGGMELQSETFFGIVSTLKDNLEAAFADLGAKILPVIKRIVGTFDKFIKGELGNFLGILGDILVPIMNVIMDLIDGIFILLQPILRLIQALLPIISTIFSAVSAFKPAFVFIAELLDELVTMLLPVLKFIQRYIASAITVAVAGIKMGITWIKLLLTPILKFFGFLFNTLFPGTQEGSIKIFDIVAKIYNFITKFLEIFTKIYSVILDKIYSVIGNIINGIRNGIQIVGQGIASFIENIKAVVQNVFMFILNIFSNVWNFIMDKFPGLAKVIMKIGEVFKNVWQGIKDFFANIWEWIVGKIGGVIKAFNKMFGLDIPVPGEGRSNDSTQPGAFQEGVERGAELAEQKVLDSFTQPTTQPGNVANVSMQNDITVNAGENVNAEAVKTSIKEVAESVFNIKFKKVLTDAGY